MRVVWKRVPGTRKAADFHAEASAHESVLETESRAHLNSPDTRKAAEFHAEASAHNVSETESRAHLSVPDTPNFDLLETLLLGTVCSGRIFGFSEGCSL